jgi:ribonuclease P protein component
VGLARVHRLRRQDFDSIYRQGKRISGTYVRAIVLISAGDGLGDPPQFGIVISKKVSKRAVQRNRLRRQIQAAFQALLPHLRPGWKGIIIVQNSALGCTYGQILPELEKILKKAEVLDGHS